ncbi:MAG TPA: YraN family protein [Candidatus Brachybacterium merdigallinarum]|nr:YraN family protein [Candidatus Brachybacterium merdigallinarum]
MNSAPDIPSPALPAPADHSPPPPAPPRVRDLSAAELGRVGEDLAARRLAQLGWTVLERNLRLTRGELDIIALDGTTLVFAEVKTRRTFVTGAPQAAVDHRKLARLRRLAGEYLISASIPHRDVRIDVIAIHAHVDGTFALEHLQAVI